MGRREDGGRMHAQVQQYLGEQRPESDQGFALFLIMVDPLWSLHLKKIPAFTQQVLSSDRRH